MAPTPEVIGIGTAICDVVIFVPKLPAPEEKVEALEMLPPAAAGVALDAVTQTSRLGLKSGFIGKIGDDPNGQLFLRQVREDGIDVRKVITVRGARTAVSWVFVDKEGNRFHVMHPIGEKGYITPKEISEREEYLRSSKLVHTEALQMPLAPMIKAGEIAQTHGKMVSFDLDINPRFIYKGGYGTEKDLRRMIELSTLFKPCKDSISGLTDEKDMRKAAEHLLEYGCKVVAITLGKDGCAVAYRRNGKISFIAPAFINEKTIDTTGAGDSFVGAFIYGLIKGWEVKKIATFANACASVKTTKVGARNMPTLDEVKSFLGRGTVNWEHLLL